MATTLLCETKLDLKQTISSNRLLGLWRMLKGFRLMYAGALVSQALSAAAKTTTSLLLAYLVDKVLLQNRVAEGILLIAVAFVALAVVEGTFSFMTGKLVGANRRRRCAAPAQLSVRSFAAPDLHLSRQNVDR